MSEAANDKLPIRPGRIFSEFWISCGGCEHQQPLACEKNGRKAALDQDWIFTKAYGWLCPKCAERK